MANTPNDPVQEAHETSCRLIERWSELTPEELAKVFPPRPITCEAAAEELDRLIGELAECKKWTKRFGTTKYIETVRKWWEWCRALSERYAEWMLVPPPQPTVETIDEHDNAYDLIRAWITCERDRLREMAWRRPILSKIPPPATPADQPTTTADPVTAAIGILVATQQQGDKITVGELATRIGVTRQHLYTGKKFEGVRDTARKLFNLFAEKGDWEGPHGSKTDGTLEAWDGDEDDA